jgi:hypothetical protein
MKRLLKYMKAGAYSRAAGLNAGEGPANSEKNVRTSLAHGPSLSKLTNSPENSILSGDVNGDNT